MIVLDTSFLVSFYHTGDANHSKALEMARKHKDDEKILSDVILFETLTILGLKAGMGIAKEAKEELLSNEKIRFLSLEENERIKIIEQFLLQAGKLSTADMTVFYLAKEMRSSILAFDKELLKLF